MRIRLLGGCLTLALAASLASAQLPILFDQSPPDPALGSRNSNTGQNTVSTQQIADDFVLNGPNTSIAQIDLWNVFINSAIPSSLPIELRIYNDAGGNPGSIAFQETVNVTLTSTGQQNLNGNTIYFGEAVLTTPFTANPGQTYWLSPLGDDPLANYSWQFHNASGSRRSRPSPTGSWSTFSSDMSFVIRGVPEPATAMLLGLAGLLLIRRR